MSLKTFFTRYSFATYVIFIGLLALLLRLIHLDYQSLWVDEIVTMGGSDPELSIRNIIEYSKTDQPPVFFLLLHFWFKLFPYTDYSGRLMAVVIGLTGVLAVYFLGKQVKDSRAGLIAAFITSFTYIHIRFSQEARFYSLVFLLATLSFYFFIRSVDRKRFHDFLFYYLFTVLLLYTHYYGLVVFASQGILFLLLLVLYPADRRFIILSVLSGLLITVSLIPWIPVFYSDTQIAGFWIQPEPLYFPLKYFYVYFKDIFTCLVFGALLVWFLVSRAKLWRLTGKFGVTDFILIGWVFFCFLIPFLYSVIFSPMLHVRYTLIALPGLIMLITLGLDLLERRFQRFLLISAFCTSLITLFFIEEYYTKPLKEDWRGLARIVGRSLNAGEKLVSPHADYCNYYFNVLYSQKPVIFPDQFQFNEQQPAGVWWLTGFDRIDERHPIETQLIQGGYTLERTDSLFGVRARYYKVDPVRDQ